MPDKKRISCASRLWKGMKMDNKMGRRDLLGTIALAGAAVAAARTSLIGFAEAASEAGGDITSKSASELASAIRSKKLTSKAIVEASIELQR
jgi:amidase